MAKRTVSDVEYSDWVVKHEEAKLSLENRDRRIRESFSRLETSLTLLGEFILQPICSIMYVVPKYNLKY